MSWSPTSLPGHDVHPNQWTQISTSFVCRPIHMHDMQMSSQVLHSMCPSSCSLSLKRVVLTQDSTRLEALLTWMEEEPVQGSILYVVRFTLILRHILCLVSQLLCLYSHPWLLPIVLCLCPNTELPCRMPTPEDWMHSLIDCLLTIRQSVVASSRTASWPQKCSKALQRSQRSKIPALVQYT